MAGFLLAIYVFKRFVVCRLIVCQAFGTVESLAQQVVNGAHDVGYDRFGRVVDAALFAQGGVVVGEEVFVEV